VKTVTNGAAFLYYEVSSYLPLVSFYHSQAIFANMCFVLKHKSTVI